MKYFALAFILVNNGCGAVYSIEYTPPTEIKDHPFIIAGTITGGKNITDTNKLERGK